MPTHAFVGSFPSRSMAELAVSYLHANGIGAMVSADDAGGTHPHFALYRGISIRVRAEDADAARELLAEAEEQAVAVDPGMDPRDRGPTRPVAKWIIRVVGALVVVGALLSVVPGR